MCQKAGQQINQPHTAAAARMTAAQNKELFSRCSRCAACDGLMSAARDSLVMCGL